MRSGKGWAVCGMFALLAFAAVSELGAQSAALGTGPWSATWPKPSESALNLVRLMREDETILIAARQAVAQDKVKSRCFARLQPAALTGPIGSAVMLQMSTEEIDEAVRFFQTDAGRKVTETKLAQVRDGVELSLESLVGTFSLDEMRAIRAFANGSAGRKVIKEKVSAHRGVRAELYDYVTRCEGIFTGERSSQFCESQPVFTETKACSATYTVTERAGEKSRHTNVYVSCEIGLPVRSRSFIAAFEGQHETIGFAWPDERTLEVRLPPGVKVLHKQAESYGSPKQQFVYRDRKASDAPATACVRDPEFIDPTKAE